MPFVIRNGRRSSVILLAKKVSSRVDRRRSAKAHGMLPVRSNHRERGLSGELVS
jgi:hypothetical protein